MSITRRDFIKISGLTSAALVLGVTTKANIVKAGTADVELNAWISIDSSGKVTIINHRAEMGQGSFQAVPQIIAEELDANGQPGAAHQLATFDAWYPGYIDYMPMYQNIPSWWTETQGGNCATPRTTTIDSLPPGYRDLRPTTMYLSPWAQGKWGLRDAVNYMVTASLATLNYAAKFREEVLYNRYQAGRRTIEQYRSSAPYALLKSNQTQPGGPPLTSNAGAAGFVTLNRLTWLPIWAASRPPKLAKFCAAPDNSVLPSCVNLPALDNVQVSSRFFTVGLSDG